MISYYFYDEEKNPIYTDEEIRAIVAEVQDFIESDPGLGYDHPFLTFSGIAVTSEGGESDPWTGNVPDNILIGDGLLEYFKAVGLDDNAPDMIIAHEFGHHIQWELDLFYLYDEGTPEATRKIELMADAMSAYFLAHKKGASFNRKRIADVFEAAFDLGDCAFSNSDHHGTPNQRGAAISLGAQISKQNNGNIILKASEFLSIFETRYDALISPVAVSHGVD
jgi:predicted metalloprotease